MRFPADSASGVSVIMPILNEEKYLRDSVSAVLAQNYSGPLEVVLAIGPCTDSTWDIAREIASADTRVRLVENPSGRTPAALNAALEVCQYDVIVRVDGHGLLSAGYIATAEKYLRETGAAVVGGIMDAQGTTAFESAVEAAMKSPIGVGGAKFKQGGRPGVVDTVYLGVFARRWLARVGAYDESYVRTQDWELNYRIRAAGGQVRFTPKLLVTYRPRSTVRELASQYLQYGQWRRVVARQHPGSMNAKYFAPPLAVAGVVSGVLGSAFTPWALLLPGGYLLGVAGGSWWAGRKYSWLVRLRLPLVLATMHMSWGVGFLTSRQQVDPQTRPQGISAQAAGLAGDNQ